MKRAHYARPRLPPGGQHRGPAPHRAARGCRTSVSSTSRAAPRTRSRCRRNRDVFERIAWVPRTLAGVGTPDLSTEILGDTCHLPLVIAPTGFNGMLWPQGDLALAKAAADAGIPFTLSTVSNYPVAKLTAEVPGEPGSSSTRSRTRRPSTASSTARRRRVAGTLVVTTDVPVLRRARVGPAQLPRADEAEPARACSTCWRIRAGCGG